VISRALAVKIASSARKFPAVALTGPRQSGKTTLIRSLFPQKPYVSLEDLDTREYAQSDPRRFLGEYPRGAVLDEIQRAPELFSYLQTILDREQRMGMFILTGSQQFLLMERLSQTLAGRVHLLTLLPLSLEELKPAGLAPHTPDGMIFRGMYPRLYDRKIPPVEWYPDYLRTYVERDVRLLKNITDLSPFQKFLKLCAARTGQLLNLNALGEECGITHNTAKAWSTVLEASFLIYLLKPHHKNFNKRIVKMPKLYFYDTGLACSLLEIENEQQLKTHPLRGFLFETALMAELVKSRLNRGLSSNLYFWRDKTGHEIDCIIDRGGKLMPIEIKSGETMTEDSFKNLLYWKRLTRQFSQPAYLLYAGAGSARRNTATVLNWKNLAPLFKTLA